MFWITDLKKAGLLACATGTLSVLATLAGQLFIPGGWWPTTVIMSLSGAVLPIFYFALYRTKSRARVSKAMRSAGLIAGLIIAALTVVGVFNWTLSFSSLLQAVGLAAILTPAREPEILTQIISLIDLCASAATIPVLLAFCRDFPNDTQTSFPISRGLLVITNVTAGFGCLWVVYSLAVLAILPATHPQQFALDFKPPTPALFTLWTQQFRTALSSAAIYSPAFIAYESWRNPIDLTENEGGDV